MKKQKTIKQWLNTLPEPLKSSALKQLYLPVASIKMNCLSHALVEFQSWNKTEEGFDFWCSFRDALEWAESDEI